MNPTSTSAVSDRVSGAVASETNHFLVIAISTVATIGGFLFGFDSGVINGTVDGLQAAFHSDSAGTGFNVASMLLGCAVGAFFAGRLADIYGRRALLITAAVFFIVSAWGSGIASGSLEFVVYRVLGGLAVGAASVMTPAYISEVAPAAYRGRLATVQQVAIIFGLFGAFVSNYCLARWAGSSTTEFWWGFETWRWMFWVELLPATIFLIGLFFIPESPRFLVASGRKARAGAVLGRLFGEREGRQKVADIERSLSSDHRPKFSDLKAPGGGLRKIVWVGIGLASFQQLVGINVVFYYGAVLWQSVGFTESDALLINVVSGAVSIAAVITALLLIDKVGRKPLLFWGSVGMAATLAVMAAAFSQATLDENGSLQLSDTVGTVALLAANAYVVFFNASWGPVMWVMLGEMFPNQIRGSGLAVSGLAQWGSNFLITWTFPMLLAAIQLSGSYGLYALGAFISILFVSRWVHETKGRELEQMEG
ncbi:sugar porter family MFS transporter [Microbulbifer thermotolerans]|uniref:sugar porter family MFS transporter n=1 Tax=Microbulbifer thermotolerans TaxID=252514 RepID=UPI0009EE010F|nr:sugar porter family MFS transporter [Microbulbifer thermotolerans]MCX2780620.1 sugar porter family MFS transporter [Microbulbifer thermotolerans]MCX2795381.1 sugar porter family MFS transporter [Microbulbifer thermotolerans]MCX2806161.1 sugar porter family MFS transporter [Microbulbifer thermotolerans]MCX2832378.1 sugar porter family MFS transporter [Microbulbifer thermotolerans]WKT60080.1 sugar porter family MFS transporter [Microbulbifer thermotolerans]